MLTDPCQTSSPGVIINGSCDTTDMENMNLGWTSSYLCDVFCNLRLRKSNSYKATQTRADMLHINTYSFIHINTLYMC